MGMSHENCEHPRTPAGRAACRKAGGPGKLGKSGRPEVFHVPDDESGKIVKVTTRRKAAPKVSISDMPRIFRTAVDWAKTNGCEVDALPGNNDSVRVQLTRTNVGTLTLTYSHATPEGVHAVSWRPVGTSIASRVANVNEGLAKLKG